MNNGAITNSCQGDSGGINFLKSFQKSIIIHKYNFDSLGPLTTTIDGREVLLGATSYGSSDGCALPDYANVYTRIQYFLANNWIQNIAGDDFCQI